jgi:hypothetical protein
MRMETMEVLAAGMALMTVPTLERSSPDDYRGAGGIDIRPSRDAPEGVVRGKRTKMCEHGQDRQFCGEVRWRYRISGRSRGGR